MLTWLSNIFMLEIICLLSMSFCCMDTRNTANISSKYITYIITQLGGMHNNFGVFLILISVGFDKCTILQVFSLTNICPNHWDQHHHRIKRLPFKPHQIFNIISVRGFNVNVFSFLAEMYFPSKEDFLCGK